VSNDRADLGSEKPREGDSRCVQAPSIPACRQPADLPRSYWHDDTARQHDHTTTGRGSGTETHNNMKYDFDPKRWKA
jgi:hypothetical protein